MLIKDSNYMETLFRVGYVVFDKTGTLTQGVFEVTDVHHNEMENAKLLEYAALADCASSHPISKSLQKAYAQKMDCHRVSDIEEISGHGIIARGDCVSAAAGNSKLMKKLGIRYYDCHSVATIILTGDVKRVAEQVASSLGIDQVFSKLLPADKVSKVEVLLSVKPARAKLAFVGDGINVVYRKPVKRYLLPVFPLGYSGKIINRKNSYQNIRLNK